MSFVLRGVIAAAAVFAVTSVAGAADLYRTYSPTSQFYSSAPASHWDGFYVGGHVGYGLGTVRVLDEPAGPVVDSDFYGASGWLAGVQAGYNTQMDNIVFGIESDLAWAGLSGAFTTNGGNDLATSVDWLGTVRGRVGLAMDSFLVYGTAGVAFAGVTSSMDPAPDVAHARIGWVAGVGAETKITESLSLKGEVLYHDFGATEVNFGMGDFVTDYLNATTVKVGFNVHF